MAQPSIMKIYRFEDATGIGPYKGVGLFNQKHANEETHPAPWQEGYTERTDEEYCGLLHEQFPRWFDFSECIECRDNGLSLYVYEVHFGDITWKSDRQVMFLRRPDQPKQKVDWKTLYPIQE